jgi:hypothetical protein
MTGATLTSGLQIKLTPPAMAAEQFHFVKLDMLERSRPERTRRCIDDNGRPTHLEIVRYLPAEKARRVPFGVSDISDAQNYEE